MSDVRSLFNHDANQVLGRSTVASDQPGNLQLTVDNIGLKFRCIPTNTTFAGDLKINIRTGVVNQCSFGFELDHDDESADSIEFNETDGVYERTINKIKVLRDVSPVTYPAYTNTEAVVGTRTIDRVKELEEIRIKNNKDNNDVNEALRLRLIARTYL
jgi:HK97 family phage prohead protease